MKTNLLIKKVCSALLAALFLLTAMTGCSSSEDPATKAFLKAENGYNADIQSAVEKYGGVRDCVTVDFADGSSAVYNSYIRSDDIAVAFEDGSFYLFYEDEWYSCYYDDSGEAVYSKMAIFDENSQLSPQYANPGYDFTAEDGREVSLVENDDGTFVWTSSYTYENSEKEVIAVYVNDKYEITKIVGDYYEESGSLYSTTTNELFPGEENDEPIAALKEAIAATGGQTRHLTFNAVENGKIKETLTADAPAGFYCSTIFPAEYYDENGDVIIYSDIGLTQEITSPDINADLNVYFSADPQ